MKLSFSFLKPRLQQITLLVGTPFRALAFTQSSPPVVLHPKYGLSVTKIGLKARDQLAKISKLRALTVPA